MKVVEHSSARLVIATGPWLLAFEYALFTSAFVALGGTFLVLRSLDPGGPDGGLLMIAIGGVLALVGLAKARTARMVFDRVAQCVLLTTRSVFSQTERRVPLADVAAAISFGPAYSLHTLRTQRLALELRSEAAPLLFTPYTSPTQKTADLCVVVNRWLAQAATGPDPTSAR